MPDKTNKERLAIIETKVTHIEENVKEIKESCKEIPRMKTIVGTFSMLISAIVAGVTSYFVKRAV